MRSVFDADPGKGAIDGLAARLAANQHGVFGRRQLVRLGATRGLINRRLAAVRWETVAVGVFRLAGAPPSWRQSLMVACLAWGEGSAISHRAGAVLLRLAGFESAPVELIVPPTRKRQGPGIVHRSVLVPSDIKLIQAIPVTTPARTLIDLAAVCTPEAVEEALDDALRRRLVSLPQLRWLLDHSPKGRRGTRLMRSLVRAREPGAVPQSVFETKVRRLLREAGLPEPALQYEIRSAGRVVGVLDFAFPSHRLAIEADGFQFHSNRKQFDQDRVRGNQLMLLGWRVIHVTWTDLTSRPQVVIESIKAALTRPPR